MGLFAILVLAAFSLWLIRRALHVQSPEDGLKEPTRQAFDGARVVSTQLFGSLGGQAMPDFGPTTMEARLEDAGPQVEWIESPPLLDAERFLGSSPAPGDGQSDRDPP